MNRFSIVAAAIACAVLTGALRADVLTLKTGESLTGTSGGVVDGAHVFVHPVLGELRVPLDQVESVVVDDAAAEQAAKVESAKKTLAAAGQPVPDPEAEAPPEKKKWQLFPGWDSTFEAGASGAAGNSEYVNIYLKFLTQREDENSKSSVGSTYFLDTSDGDRTANEFRAFGRHDWLWPDSPWFWFAKGDFEIDEFESWDYRITGHTGPGYELVKRDDLQINLLAGVGAVAEFGGDSGDEFYPEALVGAELSWKPTDRQTVEAYVFYYPDLSEIREGRTTAGASWAVLLDEANNLSLKFGVESEYESETEGDADHLDLKGYGALVFEF